MDFIFKKFNIEGADMPLFMVHITLNYISFGYLCIPIKNGHMNSANFRFRELLVSAKDKR